MADDYDIAIIGGGINGASIARDAAMRGLRVLLLEQNDFCSGTTAWSSRLIHGGLRYLEYAEFPLVFESLRERRRLQVLAPHLVRRLRMTIPVFQGSRRGRFIIWLGMVAYDLLSVGKRVPRHRMLDRAEMLRESPGLQSEGLKGGAQYYDAQVTFAERLVLENVVSAAEAGADVRNYSPVTGIELRENGRTTLRFVDRDTAAETQVQARVVINAAGPWVDRVLGTANREMSDLMGGTKGSHIIVGPFDGAPESAFYVEARADGRPFFIIPWFGQYLIGTTDIRYDGDPADVAASESEVAYLLNETNHVFPHANLVAGDIHYTYSGVRPLPRRAKGPESAITRKHIIFRHRDEARGLISIIGGKLTTYRNLAEQAVDKACRQLGGTVPACRTRDEPLPGGGGLDAARDRLESDARLSRACAERLLSIYGSRAVAIADDADAGFVDAAKTVLVAEVMHAIRNEFAVTLVDILHRRTMLGLSADQGRAVADPIAVLAAGELGWDDVEKGRQLDALRKYNARLKAPAG